MFSSTPSIDVFFFFADMYKKSIHLIDFAGNKYTVRDDACAYI